MMKIIAITGAGVSGKSTIVNKLNEEFSNKIIIIPEITEIYRNSKLPFPLTKEQINNYKYEYIKSIITIQS